jgi:hypothetical protein
LAWPPGTAMAVSNPVAAARATGLSVAGVGPANTRQALTEVAQFQLA